MEENAQPSQRKILVVEDSRTQAEYLRHILESAGYAVCVAGDGEEALRAISDDRPDAVLTDIVMPGMDGYELCRRIKADKKTTAIPVILVTQLYDPGDVLKGLEDGADNFIIKPYDAGQIASRVAELFAVAASRDSDRTLPPFTIVYAGKKHRIASGRARILAILLSTYEFAIRKNQELQDAQQNVSAMNEELLAAIDDLQTANHKLAEENAERGRVEKALADANRKLGLMTSVTRHDINNQSLALQAFIELAEAKVTDPDVLQYLRRAKTATVAIQRQIEFTKNYEDIGVHAPQWQDLGEIVESQRALLKGAGIELSYRDAGYEVYADPLLTRVFENLVDNSIRHGKQVGLISVRTTRHPNGFLVIEYRDDGEGVPEEDKERIFRKGFGKNTGLGLFLTREILGMTGILIAETGTPGKGVRFEISVPPEGFRKRT